MRYVGCPFADVEDSMVQPGLLDGGRASNPLGVVGIPVDLEASVSRGLEQQRHVLCPVAGDNAVSAGRLDLGYVRCEIGDLLEGVELVANDLNIRAFGGQHLTCRGTHRLT